MSFVDINCDMGESYGNYSIGNDEAIFPHITSCNIACGMHAGDPYHIEKTIDLALKHKVQIGAHPGYPDLQGFGRRIISMRTAELSAFVKYQVAAVKGMVESKAGVLKYVKPHGALYNQMAKDIEVAQTVLAAIKCIDPELKVMGLAGSLVKEVAEGLGMEFVAEAFADRQYEADGSLRTRDLGHSVFDDPHQAAAQVVSICLEQKTKSLSGKDVNISAQSFCIHGDNPSAVNVLKAISRALEQNGIHKKPF